MIRISPPTLSAQSALRYYLHIASEGGIQYYKGEEKSPGIWFGQLAHRLGLPLDVKAEAFTALCNNRHPGTGGAGEQLTAKQQSERRVGWDITFNPPKSVSVLHVLSGNDQIVQAVQRAAKATLREMEKEARVRVRKGGKDEDRVTGEIVAAMFRHYTTRPTPVPGKKETDKSMPDPHLHVHAFVMNVTYDPVEERYKALQIGRMKELAPFAESFFHADLARRLGEMGIALERRGRRWEVAGVSDELIQRFSRRTQEIEKLAKEKGIDNPDRKAELGAKTRQPKHQDFSYEELRKFWCEQVTPWETERVLRESMRTTPFSPMSAGEALNYSAGHWFQRNSVMDERTLIYTALEYGMGRIKLEELQATFNRQDYLRHRDEAGELWVTTPDLLAEERRVIDWARQGIGSRLPLGDAKREMKPDAEGKTLTADQEKAARLILGNCDRVTVLAGVAGAGKTTMMRQVVDGIRESGSRVMALAPSSEASRGVLRGAGFSNAETVAMFLNSPKLQEFVRNGVIWVDEASLLGTQDFKKLFAVAEKMDARVLLSGDEKQHASPNRGDGLRILRQYAGLQPVQLTEILRQQGQYREAVEKFSRGDTLKAFDQLDKLGHIHECEDMTRFERLAEKYVETLAQGRSVLAVAPTHAEAGTATAHIRHALKQAQRLGADEREVIHHRNLQWTEAEKMDVSKYREGQKLFFHKAGNGVRCGAWLEVTERSERHLLVRDGSGKVQVFTPAKPDRFSVYTAEPVQFAPGDTVRFTQNLTLGNGKRINSGSMYRLQKFSPHDGALVLSPLDDKEDKRTFRVPQKTYLMTHGYVVTSHASQGRTVNTVLISEGTASLRAASLQQAYVSASRGNTEVHWYTDDKQALREAIARSAERVSASELAEKAALQRLWDWQIRLRRDAIAYQMDQARTRGVTRSTLQNIGEKGLNQLQSRSPNNNKEQGRSYER